jgi:hypothetical protein
LGVVAAWLTVAQASGAPQVPDNATVLAALCPRGRRCRVVDRTSAGTDAEGQELVVARVRVLGKGVGDPKREEPCLLEPVGVFRLRESVVVSSQRIITLYQESECWYGSSGGDETLGVGQGRATFSSEGGTSWRWRQERIWALSPTVELISEEHEGWHNFGVTHELSRTDHRRQRTEVVWRTPTCGHEPEEAGGGSDPQGDPTAYRYLVIPRSRGGATADWKGDQAGRRWLEMDATGEGGYLLHGPPGASSDARLRVTAPARDTLLVDVFDDHYVAEAPSWIHADHLELWGTARASSYMDECLIRKPPSPDAAADGQPVGRAWQWGVMLDGSVKPGAGHPPVAPTVEVATVEAGPWGKGVRFRVRLPAHLEAVSVVYSDSDDGLTQKRLIGTSRVRFGDAASLGRIEKDE